MPPAKLARMLSSDSVSERREAYSKTFERFCARLDAVATFAAAFAHERALGVPVPADGALATHAGAEDALDYVCKSYVKDGEVDVAQVRAAARSFSDAQVRAVAYDPRRLDAELLLVTVERAPGWPRLADGLYRGLSSRAVREVFVAGSGGHPRGGEGAALPRVSDDNHLVSAVADGLFA